MRKSRMSAAAAALAAVMTMGSVFCSAGELTETTELAVSEDADLTSESEIYPTNWNLSAIYASTEEWQADYDKVMEMLNQYDTFRGTLNNAQSIYDYLMFQFGGELTQIQKRLQMYADRGSVLNPSDPVFMELMSKLSVMNGEETKKNAFAKPEIFALPLETRQEIFADPILKPYAYVLRTYTDPDSEPLSEETTTALAMLSPALGRGIQEYSVFFNVDCPGAIITMPDGTDAELTEDLYTEIIYSNEYSREFKELCNQKLLQNYGVYANTYAAMLDSCVSENWAVAQIDRYETSKEAALDAEDVAPAIYDKVIEAAHKGAPDYQRYLNIHKNALGLEKQYPYDMGTFISDYMETEYTYDQGVEMVRSALGILGDDYMSVFDRIITSEHVDVYPTDTKEQGAECTSMVLEDGIPYVKFNFSGFLFDVDTIAHEMGHAVYTTLSAQNQPALNQYPTTFTQEIASTTNELLFYRALMDQAQSDDERLYYLEDLLSMFSNSLFNQALYAEFEDSLYQTIEAGGSLDAAKMGENWINLLTEYRGEEIGLFPESAYGWVSIPHFYYDYYVYQYATSITYAASIYERICNGEEGALESYKQFLTLGSSMSPAELLTVAGIDPLEDATYQKALDYFSDLVDEYEELVNAKLSDE